MVFNVTTATLFATAMLAASAAHAGSCPEDKVLETPRTLSPKTGPGYDGAVAASIDLTGWRNMGEFKLRLRTLTIPPKGVVPLHNHGDRPAIVHVISGELLEHNALCAEPIVHKAGETTPEFGAKHAHWWENPLDEPVMAVSADVVPFESQNNTDM